MFPILSDHNEDMVMITHGLEETDHHPSFTKYLNGNRAIGSI